MQKKLLSKEAFHELKNRWIELATNTTTDFFQHLPDDLLYRNNPYNSFEIYHQRTTDNPLITKFNSSLADILPQIFSELFWNYVNATGSLCAERLKSSKSYLFEISKIENIKVPSKDKFFDDFKPHLAPGFYSHAQTEHYHSALTNQNTYISTNQVSNDFCLYGTALEQYFNDHITYTYGEQRKVRHITYSNASKTFLLALIQNIKKGKVPYTVATQYGMSIKSLSNFFTRMYETQPSVDTDALEAILYFHNLEQIFAPSLIAKILQSCKEEFSSNNDIWLCQYFCTIRLLIFLKDCPLNSLKHFIWTAHRDFLKKSSEVIDTYFLASSEVLFITQILEPLYPMLKDSFKQLMDELYDINSNTLNDLEANVKQEHWNALITDISPLLKNETRNTYFNFSWSNQNFLIPQKSFMQLASIFDEYFDFYLLLYFYLPQSSSETIAQLIYDPWHDFYNATGTQYNSFLKYLLATKRPLKNNK